MSWHDTILERYGEQWILDKARKGGQAKVPKGFAKNLKLASESGRKGGLASKRTKRIANDL